MKIVCTTENVIEQKESCRKTYCCNKLKIALNPYKNGKESYDWLSSQFSIGEKKIELTTHHSYHEGDHEMTLDFCPFCGKPLIIEHKKIDKTGLPPRPRPRPRPPVLKAFSPPPPLKKKHWWSK